MSGWLDRGLLSVRECVDDCVQRRRKDMREWILYHEDDGWSVRLDFQILDSHLEYVFRRLSVTLADRIRLLIAMILLGTVLSLDLNVRLRIFRIMSIYEALCGIGISLLVHCSLLGLCVTILNTALSRQQFLGKLRGVISVLHFEAVSGLSL